MIEIPGMSPTRRVVPLSSGGFTVFVKPPDFTGCPEVSVFLSEDQFLRYRQWRNREGLIQDLLADLSASEREMLMTGLGDEDFHRMAGDAEEG